MVCWIQASAVVTAIFNDDRSNVQQLLRQQLNVLDHKFKLSDLKGIGGDLSVWRQNLFEEVTDILCPLEIAIYFDKTDMAIMLAEAHLQAQVRAHQCIPAAMN